MKIQFYLLPLLLFFGYRASAQSCAALTISCVPRESRCVSTGSIQVNVSGGSGNYTFKAVGPVTPPSTSSNNITGLSPGYYSIQVKDLGTGCTKQIDSVHVTGTYNDPRFQLTKTDVTCANNNGTISVVNQQFGRSPFSYSIIAPSPMGVGTTSTTGTFTGLSGGEYSIQLQDSCGGIQVRKVTVESYSWWFDMVNINPFACDSAHVHIVVRDNRGNVSTSGTGFTGFSYGYVINGDTTWGATTDFDVYLGHSKVLDIVVKDPCGQIHVYSWSFPPTLKPQIGAVQYSNLGCSTFTASLSGQNLSIPLFCINDENGNTLVCNTTGVFTNLPYGKYCIDAAELCYDTLIFRCFTLLKPEPGVAASVSITNRTCNKFTASITGQQNLFTPSYCLYDSAGAQLSCNSTGIFPNLNYGSYCIKTHDGCVDTLITRCFTVAKLIPTLTSYAINGAGCTSFNVTVSGNNLITPNFCLYNNLGQLITCDSTGIFSGVPHGNYCVRAISCGDTTNSICFTSNIPVPSLGPVTISNKQCSTFTATATGASNLTNPDYCLFNANDSLLRCNTTGIFDSLPYGSYCIKMHNNCFDTTIVRCFTGTQTVPSLNSTMQVLARKCATVSFQVLGSNLSSPRYCLYNASNTLIGCNLTGIFNDQPYGKYCVTVDDNCYDTTMTICQTFTPVHGITITTAKPCIINKAYVDVTMTSGIGPFNIKIYHPNGSIVKDSTTSANPVRFTLSALPGTTQYMVIGKDSCGNRDTAYIQPDANIVTTSTTVRAKCPSASWANGAGDILAGCTSNSYAVIPKITRKNATNVSINYSSVAGSVYTFVDLEPATYVVEYTQQTCNIKLYDTIVVPPYAYPTQGQSALYQCDNNGFSMGADVNGGVSPYTYQIIGSTPSSPSITTPQQASPVFSINNGTVYSLVRLRTIDACGNATLSDVSVLPLQNVSISASDSCFYQNITLAIDTVPNASYYWYKKTSPVDSVLIDSGLTYNMPFFQPEDVGQYVCKMVVNLGCITRIARFDLFGCTIHTLASGFVLNGKKVGRINRLTWNQPNNQISRYVIERQTADGAFQPIGELAPQVGDQAYVFDDIQPLAGLNKYRVRVLSPNISRYSNSVVIASQEQLFMIYPNPATDGMFVEMNGTTNADHLVELVNAGGQKLFSQLLKAGNNSRLFIRRHSAIVPGMYLVRITDNSTRVVEIRKVIFR